MIKIIPLVILAILGCIGLGITIGKHGKTTKENGWASLIAFIIQWGLILWAIL